MEENANVSCNLMAWGSARECACGVGKGWGSVRGSEGERTMVNAEMKEAKKGVAVFCPVAVWLMWGGWLC